MPQYSGMWTLSQVSQAVKDLNWTGIPPSVVEYLVIAGSGGGGRDNTGGNGGSGIVILSVPTSRYSGTTTGSPTITTSGSNTIIKFTASGTYTA